MTIHPEKFPGPALTSQRRQVVAAGRSETWPRLKSNSRTNASADTRAKNTPPSTVELTSPSKDAALTAALAANSAASKPDSPAEANATTALTVSTSSPVFEPDHQQQYQEPPDDKEEVPEAIAEASLAEVLLWRLGIPADRARVLADREKAAAVFDLAPPLTPEKIAAAIAQVSIALLNHELQPAEANVMLFALQTMLSAVRVSITADTIRQRIELQKEKNSWTPPSPTPAKPNSSNSPRKKTSPSRRPSGSRSASSPTTTRSSPKPRSASSRPAKSLTTSQSRSGKPSKPDSPPSPTPPRSPRRR